MAVLLGDDRDERLYGTAGNDGIFGRRGNDRLFGAAGDDLLEDGDDRDRLYGDRGDDVLEVIDAGDAAVVSGAGEDLVIILVHCLSSITFAGLTEVAVTDVAIVA